MIKIVGTVTVLVVVLTSVFGPTQGQERSALGSLASAVSNAPGAVSGVVVDGRTNAPVRDAMVMVSNGKNGETPRRQITDNAGRFVFSDVAPGTLMVSASKSGYLESGLTQREGAESRIVLNGGEWVADVRLSLWPSGGIDGTVLDELGEPVVDVWVRLLTKIRVVGTDYFAVRGLTRTEDRGRYRFVGLAPGDYFVQVPSIARSGSKQAVVGSLGGESTLLISPHFPVPPPMVGRAAFTYPSGYSEYATIAGNQRSGVDVHLNPTAAFQLSGTVVGPPESWRALPLRLLSQDSPVGVENEVATTMVDENGRFSFVDVPAGAYSLDASRTVGQFLANSTDLGARAVAMFRSMEFSKPLGGPNIGMRIRDLDSGPDGLQLAMSTFEGGLPGFWARQSVVVSSEERNIIVRMRETGVMRGRIIKELSPGAIVPELAPSVGIHLEPADGSPALGLLTSNSELKAPSDQFTISGLRPGEYLLRTQHGWHVKSISWNGRVYTDVPFDAAKTSEFDDVEVVVTNGSATLTGRALDERGVAPPGVVVVVFPSTQSLWTNFGLWPPKIRSVFSAKGGEYEFAGLPAGDYYVIAIDGHFVNSQLDPEFLRVAARLATQVSLSWSQTLSANLSVYHQVR